MKECVVCSKSHNGAGQTCSRGCRSAWIAQRQGKLSRFRVCEVCGVNYRATYSKQRTCGRECGRRLPEYLAAVERNADLSRARKFRYPSQKVFFGECDVCGAWFSARKSGGRYCSSACSYEEEKRRARDKWNAGYKDSDAAQRRREKARLHRIAAWEPYTCQACGAESVGFSGRLYCSTECARSFVRKRCRKRLGRRYHQKRAKMYGVDYEPGITLDKLAERDDGICGLCGEKVVAEWPNLMSGSIDHVTPMSAGGSHTWSNVQLAHFLCNSYKGADADVDFRLEDESCQQLLSSTRPVATAA